MQLATITESKPKKRTRDQTAKPGNRFLQVQVTEGAFKRAKVAAAFRDVSLSVVINELVLKHLPEYHGIES